MVERSGDISEKVEIITRIVERYPVQCAVLYGSHIHGTATPDSDIDIAVAFEDDLSRGERLEQRIELTVELGEALGTDDIDIADLDVIQPAVGRSALESGLVLCGEQEVLDSYRDQFGRETVDESHEERMRRFDDVLERLEGRV